ncbi:unnamed protein product, partial [Mesorhabditis spiculigera]
MISMINYPSDSPKEFYGGATGEGRFYFPNRYLRVSKKEKRIVTVSQADEPHQLIPEQIELRRQASDTMWTGLLHKKIIEKLQEGQDIMAHP